MIDTDVANLYNYETKRINETVRRNTERFPEEFCFKITSEEYNVLKSQFATSKVQNFITSTRGGKQKLPYVFTEKGTDKMHDRFIIIDNNELYHCGASIKDLGKI